MEINSNFIYILMYLNHFRTTDLFYFNAVWFIVEFQLLLTLDANIWMLQMSTRRGSTDVHEFDGLFLGFRARFKVTSVIGHVFRSLLSQIRQQKKKSLFDTTLLTWYNKFNFLCFQFARLNSPRLCLFLICLFYILFGNSLFLFMLDGACRFLRVSCYLFNRCCFFFPLIIFLWAQLD